MNISYILTKYFGIDMVPKGADAYFILADYFSLGYSFNKMQSEKKHIEKFSMENIMIKEPNDYEQMFDKHFQKYLKEHPYSNIHTFVDLQIVYLNFLVDELQGLIINDELFENSELYIMYKDYVGTFLKRKLDNITTHKVKHKKTINAFRWQGNSDELTELYQKMKDSKLIAVDTSEADFKAIFEAKPLNEIKPIRWMNTKVLLAYFIYKLKDKLPFSDNFWKIAESCFVNGTNLKSLANNCFNNKTGLPKNHHLIDELF